MPKAEGSIFPAHIALIVSHRFHAQILNSGIISFPCWGTCLVILLIQVILSVLFMISKSIILNPSSTYFTYYGLSFYFGWFFFPYKIESYLLTSLT